MVWSHVGGPDAAERRTALRGNLKNCTHLTFTKKSFAVQVKSLERLLWCDYVLFFPTLSRLEDEIEQE